MSDLQDLKKAYKELWNEIRANLVVTFLKLAQFIAPRNDFGQRFQKKLIEWSADEMRIAKEEKHESTN